MIKFLKDISILCAKNLTYVVLNYREWIRQEELGRDPEEALGDDTQFYLQG